LVKKSEVKQNRKINNIAYAQRFDRSQIMRGRSNIRIAYVFETDFEPVKINSVPSFDFSFLKSWLTWTSFSVF